MRESIAEIDRQAAVRLLFHERGPRNAKRILWHAVRLLKLHHRASLKKYELQRFGFDIVHGCQLRCVGCPNSTLKPKISFIAPGDFLTCLKNVDVVHVRWFRLFNYGEPLLHPDVPGLLRMISRAPWYARIVEISTNAQHHNFPALEEIFKTRVMTQLVVSCDGDGTPAEYERLRTPSKWPKFIEFIAKAKEYRDRHAPHVKLITRSVSTTPEGQRRWTEVLAPYGFEPEFRDWLVLPQSTQNPSGREVTPHNGVCHYIRRQDLYVDADGTVVPCCVHPRAFELGNLKTQKYSEILASELRAQRISQLATDRASMPICSKCEY